MQTVQKRMSQMKQQNRQKLVAHSKPTLRSEPKVKVEITGADDATRDAMERAIISAMRNFTTEIVDVKWVLDCR